jgi:tripartite ATP-independent transporter DctM subunit
VVPSIPLFTLAGYILAEGGASRRLVRLFETLFAHLPGGLAIAAVIVCAFFTSFTGASGVTIVALGGLLMPVLMATGYSQRHALGMVTGSGAIGLLFPPCVPVILYSIVAQQALEGFDPDALATHDISIENMFAGAFLPGVILLILVALWGATRRRVQSARPRFDGKEALRAIWAAKWELLMPVVAVGALLGGFVSSPVQAAALTVLYAFLVEFVLYRDLDWRRDLTRICAQSGLLIGGILLILGVALGLTHALVAAQVPERLIDWVTSTVHSPLVFLLALNVLLVIVGGLMEVYCAIVVVVPLIVPLGLQFGVDPVHLGVIILANLELGFLTPPVGLNLLLASSRFDRPMSEVVRASLPLFGVQALGVLLITYWPALTTTLPRLLAP